MSNCLITKLKSVINNDSLPLFATLTINVENIEEYDVLGCGFILKMSKETTLTIVGDGYFTDSTLSENYGKSLVVSANTDTNVYFSVGTYKILIPNKYNLIHLNNLRGSSEIDKIWGFDINEWEYCTEVDSFNHLHTTLITGSIEKLNRLTNIASSCNIAPSITGRIIFWLEALAESGRSGEFIVNNPGSTTYHGESGVKYRTVNFISQTEFTYSRTNSLGETYTDTWVKTDGVWKDQNGNIE